jgi:WD40 repeat protein/serine/threonine protein kinase
MADKSKDIEEIYNAALKKDSEAERNAYLDKACGDNQALRSRVEALLKANEQAGSFLEVPAIDSGVTLDSQPLIEGPGTKIGNYELLELIGEGGMGLVYLAQQKEPVKRHVALKIIKPGMDSKQVIARFEAEKQALALLDHPNIAHVFDAGTTETGRPYFVMEYVRGTSIVKYCDERRLNIEQRLRLFEQVCEGIHHAHQKGIIHRDIKPSNILISIHGDKAVPKIIDFGIAKAITQPLTDKTFVTFQGQLLGTPEYMSPEQVDLATQDIDTRSDIYALGVVLYELLAGVLPFERESLALLGFAEVQRTIRELEPASPSIRLTNLGEKAKTIAASRGTQVVPLARRLHRELEWIPLKAMRKDRCRRYKSASDIADDIRNYLNGNPLIAGPETATYRVQKFVRKHAGSVATVALVAAAIVIGLIISTVMYFRAEEARHKEAIARAQAEQATKKEATARNEAELSREKESVARTKAEQAEKLADEQRKLAEQRAEDYRRSLYVNSIQLADAKYREGNTRRVRELLESCPIDLRGWEWDRLNYIRDESILTLSGTSDESNVPMLGRDDCIHAAMLDPDGTRIVSGHYDGTIRVWDSVTGDKLKEFRAHDRELWLMAVCLDGRRVVSCSWDKTIKVWDTKTFEVIRTIRTPEDELIWCAAVSPDGKLIASSAAGKRVLRIWDVQTGLEAMTLGHHKSDVQCIIFSPDGKRIISGGREGDIKVWDATAGKELMTLHVDPDVVACIAVNSDGSQIASSGVTDRVIKLWDTRTAVQLATYPGSQPDIITSLAFSRDGKYIVSGDNIGLIKIWETATASELRTLVGHEGGVTSLAFSLDEKRIISSSWDGTTKLWDISNDHKANRLKVHQGSPYSSISIAFSPNGKRIASNMDGMVKVFDVNSCTELMVLHKPTKGRQPGSISFSSDGRLIGSSLPEGIIKVWDAETNAEVMTLQATGQRVWDLAFSPDNKRIVTVSVIRETFYAQEGTIKIWNILKGKEIMSLPLGELVPLSVAFSPDGKQIVSGGQGGTIKVWDVSSGTEVMTINGHHGHVYYVTFSPDGKLIAEANHQGIASIWDANSGVELLTLGGHNDIIYSIMFSPDGRRIITGSNDRTARLWDVATGAELLTLPFDSTVTSATFDTKGTLVAAATIGGSVFLLDSGEPAGGYELRNAGKTAMKLVDELQKKLCFYHNIIDDLQLDLTLDSTVRKLALQISNSRKWEDADKLGREILEVVRIPDKDTEVYKSALEKAQKANEWEPNNPAILNTLGASQYRLGSYENALTTLTKVERILSDAGEEPDPWNLAFKAMTLNQIGQSKQANIALDQLRKLCQDEEHVARDMEVQGLLAEAEKLITGKEPLHKNEP